MKQKQENLLFRFARKYFRSIWKKINHNLFSDENFLIYFQEKILLILLTVLKEQIFSKRSFIF